MNHKSSLAALAITRWMWVGALLWLGTAACGESAFVITIDDRRSPLPAPQWTSADGDETSDPQDEPPGKPPHGVFIDPSDGTATPLGDGTDPEDSGGSDSGSGSHSAGTCGAFTVTSALAGEEAGDYVPSRRWRFSTDEDAVWVNLVFTGLDAGAHSITIDFYDPEGAAYYSHALTFTVGEPPGPGQVQAQRVDEGWVVSYALVLRGSPIESDKLWGIWRYSVSYEHEDQAVDQSWFRITGPVD